MKNISLPLILFLFLSVSANAQTPAYLPSGLMAWFPFTGNAIDSTMHGHDGTVYGTANAKGRYGVPNTAFKFNGTSDYIYIPAGSLVHDITVDITASLTISAWVKSYNYSYASQMQIYWRGNSLPAHDPHMLYINSGDVRIRRDVDPGTVVNEVGYTCGGLDTNYHLFTGTYDSATSIMCMYIDGVMKNRAYLPGLQTYPTATMYNYIGAVDGGTWQFLYGYIDELGIWNRALTPCEVAALYSSIPDIITSNPVSSTVSAGLTTMFTVGVSAPVAPTYQWQVNTGTGFVNLTNATPYSGVTTPSLTVSPASPTLTGYQYRCVVSSDSCIGHSSNPATLTVNALGTNTVIKVSDHFTLSPNPNVGIFTLSSNGQYVANIMVEVTDMMGRMVYEEVLTPKNGLLNHPINIGQKVPDGTYLLRVRTDAGNEVFRVVVEH